jgi:hypothetical protein
MLYELLLPPRVAAVLGVCMYALIKMIVYVMPEMLGESARRLGFL